MKTQVLLNNSKTYVFIFHHSIQHDETSGYTSDNEKKSAIKHCIKNLFYLSSSIFLQYFYLYCSTFLFLAWPRPFGNYVFCRL